jgi:hypothetical protein
MSVAAAEPLFEDVRPKPLNGQLSMGGLLEALGQLKGGPAVTSGKLPKVGDRGIRPLGKHLALLSVCLAEPVAKLLGHGDLLRDHHNLAMR